MDNLIDQYKQMHENPEMFAGLSLMPHVHRIKRLIDQTNAKTVLDYGCGKGLQYERQITVEKKTYPNIEAYWGVEVTKYDPAHTPHSHWPGGTYGGVVCTDVLEHSETTLAASAIVEELFDCADGFVFASISCREAIKHLPDGRNAHTCIEPPEFWRGVFLANELEGVSWKIVCDDGERQYVYANDGLEQTIVNVKQALQVKTKNCVPHEQIVEQVQFSQSLPLNWIEECKPHAHTAVIVSAGPSWKNFIPEIKKRYGDQFDRIACTFDLGEHQAETIEALRK